jgi:hypothetical protein
MDFYMDNSFNIHYDVRMDSKHSLSKTDIIPIDMLLDDCESNRDSYIILHQPILQYRAEIRAKSYYLLFVKSMCLLFILTVGILIFVFYK